MKTCLVCFKEIKKIISKNSVRKKYYVYDGHVNGKLSFCRDCWIEIVKGVEKEWKKKQEMNYTKED